MSRLHIVHIDKVTTTTAMSLLLLCCLYLSSIYYRSEAVSLTCDDVCPGNELIICNCSVSSPGLTWRLPGSVTLTFDSKTGVGSNRAAATNGISVAVITNKTGGVPGVHVDIHCY